MYKATGIETFPSRYDLTESTYAVLTSDFGKQVESPMASVGRALVGLGREGLEGMLKARGIDHIQRGMSLPELSGYYSSWADRNKLKDNYGAIYGGALLQTTDSMMAGLFDPNHRFNAVNTFAVIFGNGVKGLPVANIQPEGANNSSATTISTAGDKEWLQVYERIIRENAQNDKTYATLLAQRNDFLPPSMQAISRHFDPTGEILHRVIDLYTPVAKGVLASDIYRKRKAASLEAHKIEDLSPDLLKTHDRRLSDIDDYLVKSGMTQETLQQQQKQQNS